MSSERHARVKALFLAACELPIEERPAFLMRECAGDRALEAEVQELLEFHRAETPSLHVRESAPPELEEVPGYRVLQRLGVGGMGEVYEAEQLEPVRRRVALKVIKWGMDSREVLARFESERQALAIMSHDAIARVYDAGATAGGRPFFAMELVHGVPITSYCDAHRLSMRERMELFVRVCEGVQHAHQRGVIHRDLKPSNILVTVENERPAPKIIDFGVAKAVAQRLTERTLFTELGQWIGTPEYMSPEQAEMTGLDIDTRTDVYALGVILYELLVGAQPFDAAILRSLGFDEMRRRIREQEPPRPSTRVSSLGPDSELAAERRRTDRASLVRELRGDLDWIVMCALEKDRTRRYPTPMDLAEDVRRHLRDEPVEAGPPGGLYRARKFVRRHRVGVGVAALVFVLLVAGIVGTSIGMARAREEAATANRLVMMVREMLWAMGPGNPVGATMPVDEFLARGEARVERELGERPLLKAEMLSILGEVRMSLDDLDAARPMLEEALAIRERLLDPGDRRIGDSLNALGVLRQRAGRWAEAERLFERSIEVLEAAVGPDDVPVANVHGNLCQVRRELGDLDRALASCERAIAVLERVEGPDSLNAAGLSMAKASILRLRGDTEGALALDRHGLDVRERVLGPDHAYVGGALYAVGLDERTLGRRESALRHLERALAIQERALGPDSVAVAFPLEQLALARGEGWDPAVARARLERALAIRERGQGPSHPELVWSLRPYGILLGQNGETEAGWSALARALDLAESGFGPDHLETGLVVEAMGNHLLRQRDPARLDRARELLERAAASFARIQGESAYLTQRARYNLVCTLSLQGRTADALDRLEALLATGWARPGIEDDPDLDPLRAEPRFRRILATVRDRLREREG